MAELTAAAHLRSSGRQGPAIADDLIIFGTNAGWKTDILQEAAGYAHVVNRYYLQFLQDNPVRGFKKHFMRKEELHVMDI